LIFEDKTQLADFLVIMKQIKLSFHKIMFNF
jgi:hypothetical protein